MNTSMSRVARQLSLAALCVAALHGTAIARPIVVNRTVWGSITPTVSTGVVKLNLSIRCGSGNVIKHCSIEVEIPAGSDGCQVCSIFAAAINSSPCAASQGYTASCDGLYLVVGNIQSDPCQGAKVQVDPEGLGELRLGLDAQTTGNDFAQYLRFYEAASGNSVNASFDPGVTLVYTAHYFGMQNPQARMVSVPTGPGMTAENLSQLIASAFAELGMTEVVAEGPAVRVDPPVRPTSFEGVGLRARWLAGAWPDDPCRTLEIVARPGDEAFALARAAFDVHVGPGVWTDVQIVTPGATGSPGTVSSEGVEGVRVEQTLIEGVEPAPDPSTELVIWRGTWCSEDPTPRCVTAQTTTQEFRIFSVDPCAGRPPPCDRTHDLRIPGSPLPPPPRPSIERPVTAEGSDTFGVFGAPCNPQSGTFGVMILINDDALGYVLSGDPNLRCTVSGDNCDLPLCPADFNQDGMVDVADIAAFMAAFEAGDLSADLNHDGGVDMADFELFFWHYNQGC